jgi:hypothetical protein
MTPRTATIAQGTAFNATLPLVGTALAFLIMMSVSLVCVASSAMSMAM